MLNELMTKVERAVSAIEKVAAALEKLACSQVPSGTPAAEGAAKEKKPRAPKDTSKNSAASAPSTEAAAASNPPVEQPTTTTPAEDDDDFGAPAETKTYTADDIRAASIKLAGKKGEEVAKKIIKEVGSAPNVKSMLPEKFPMVMAAIEEAMK